MCAAYSNLVACCLPSAKRGKVLPNKRNRNLILRKYQIHFFVVVTPKIIKLLIQMHSDTIKLDHSHQCWPIYEVPRVLYVSAAKLGIEKIVPSIIRRFP